MLDAEATDYALSITDWEEYCCVEKVDEWSGTVKCTLSGVERQEMKRGDLEEEWTVGDPFTIEGTRGEDNEDEEEYYLYLDLGLKDGTAPGEYTANVTFEAYYKDEEDPVCEASIEVDVKIMAVDIDPTLDIVKDGSDSETFTATTSPLCLSDLTYEWTWVAEPEAGNNPSVDFSSSEDQETTVELAHWYALPDDTCEAHQNSSYTLTCIVKHNGQPVCSDTTSLCVTLIEPGGKCSPPQLQGAPSIAYDSGEELYYVSGVGTLSRILASFEINLSETSQFRDKLETHENQHKQDFDNGFDGHEFVTVEEFYARIEGLTDSTQAGLEARIYEEAEAYFQDEAEEIENVRGRLEIRAYQVSDPIAPQYYYHNCGQYTCP